MGRSGEISTSGSKLSVETYKKGDEEGRGEQGIEMDTHSNRFINSFPSQPTHDDVIRALGHSLPTTNMPDPRFTRLRSDPRFRTLKRHKNKVAVDSRFSSVFSTAKKTSRIGVYFLYPVKPF